MLYLFSKIYWKLSGWRISGHTSPLPKKLVLIAGPHTSWADVVVGLAASSILDLRHIKFLGKKELFVWPVGWFFRRLGGIPVDRINPHGLVQQLADQFKEDDEFIICMMPEGTRKKVTRLRTGFYHIAKKANAPILMAGFDFSKREVVIAEPFFTSDNEEKDLECIISFFAPIKGKYPGQGLSHLKESLY